MNIKEILEYTQNVYSKEDLVENVWIGFDDSLGSFNLFLQIDMGDSYNMDLYDRMFDIEDDMENKFHIHLDYKYIDIKYDKNMVSSLQILDDEENIEISDIVEEMLEELRERRNVLNNTISLMRDI